MFSQLQIDVDSDADDEEMVSALVSPSAPEEFKNYLVQDRHNLRVTHTGRRFDESSPAWIRSAATHGNDSPTKVSVELAAETLSNIQLEGGRIFMVTRIDVSWDKDRWVVTDFANGFVGDTPIGAHDLLRDSLSGPGWRQLRP